jgi:hypothetical protein
MQIGKVGRISIPSIFENQPRKRMLTDQHNDRQTADLFLQLPCGRRRFYKLWAAIHHAGQAAAPGW